MTEHRVTLRFVVMLLAVAILVSVGSLAIAVTTTLDNHHTNTALTNLDHILVTRCTARTSSQAATLTAIKANEALYRGYLKLPGTTPGQAKLLNAALAADETAAATTLQQSCTDFLVTP